MKLSKQQSRFIASSADARRLVAHVEQSADGCWVWKGSRTNGGYGLVYFRSKTWKAHRASYTIFCGEIPPSLMVCHHCDNPSCINPSHLFLGHARTNVMDMMRKGRARSTITALQNHFRAGHAPRGENSSGAKLSRETAEDIIARAANGEMTGALAAHSGLARTTVQRILNGSTWAELERPPCLPRKVGNPGRAALEDEK